MTTNISIPLHSPSPSRQIDMSHPYVNIALSTHIAPSPTPRCDDRLMLSERVLAQWRRLVALLKATNLLHRVMRAVLYRRIATAIEMASKVGTCCIVVSFAVTLVAAGAIRSE